MHSIVPDRRSWDCSVYLRGVWMPLRLNRVLCWGHIAATCRPSGNQHTSDKRHGESVDAGCVDV